jgi:dihydroorotate dehydrogenase electron transfer subunit
LQCARVRSLCPRVPNGKKMIERNTEIVFNKQVAQGTFLMALHSREMAAEAKPGQFVMIQVRSGLDPLLRRPFSICGVRGDDLYLILYRVVGKGTVILSGAEEGDRLNVLGPLGRGFDLTRDDRKACLVAGGIGVAPLLFLAQALGPEEMVFLAGYRTAAEIVSLTEFGLSGAPLTLSTEDGTAGLRGLVTDLLQAHWGDGTSRMAKVFTCGPLPMLKRVAAMALEHKAECQVSLESFMACGIGACLGCAVNAERRAERAYFHVCKDGPVFRAESLDWDSL